MYNYNNYFFCIGTWGHAIPKLILHNDNTQIQASENMFKAVIYNFSAVSLQLLTSLVQGIASSTTIVVSSPSTLPSSLTSPSPSPSPSPLPTPTTSAPPSVLEMEHSVRVTLSGMIAANVYYLFSIVEKKLLII